MSAERLVAEVRAMSREDLADQLEFARTHTPAEIVERQRQENRERAQRAAARWQS